MKYKYEASDFVFNGMSILSSLIEAAYSAFEKNDKTMLEYEINLLDTELKFLVKSNLMSMDEADGMSVYFWEDLYDRLDQYEGSS